METNRNQYTAKLKSNDTASVCFKNPSEVKYVVRADSNEPSGEVNIPGNISIGDNQATIRSSGSTRTTQAEQDQPTNR
jgi:hypothetical protein